MHPEHYPALAALAERHGGKVDFTVLTQAEMLSVFDDVMGVLTLCTGLVSITLWLAIASRVKGVRSSFVAD